MATDKTGIEWTDATWGPVTGCSKVSPGCANCYAETLSHRFWGSQYPKVPDGKGGTRFRVFEDVQTHEDRLRKPLTWKRPRRIFVNSITDLFHEEVPFEFVDRVFTTILRAPQHTFQILTKRAERMRDYMRGRGEMIAIAKGPLRQFDRSDTSNWPPKNVWLGVSVENQHFADERIPLLLETPAAVRFISAEPLLGRIDISRWLKVQGGGVGHCFSIDNEWWHAPGACTGPICLGQCCGRGLDWVIVGGESGPQARPFDIAWARSIVQQCKAAGVPVFVKQLGANAQDGDGAMHGRYSAGGIKHDFPKLTDRKGGDMDEWPADLRIRQFPQVAP